MLRTRLGKIRPRKRFAKSQLISYEYGKRTKSSKIGTFLKRGYYSKIIRWNWLSWRRCLKCNSRYLRWKCFFEIKIIRSRERKWSFTLRNWYVKTWSWKSQNWMFFKTSRIRQVSFLTFFVFYFSKAFKESKNLKIVFIKKE